MRLLCYIWSKAKYMVKKAITLTKPTTLTLTRTTEVHSREWVWFHANALSRLRQRWRVHHRGREKQSIIGKTLGWSFHRCRRSANGRGSEFHHRQAGKRVIFGQTRAWSPSLSFLLHPRLTAPGHCNRGSIFNHRWPKEAVV